MFPIKDDNPHFLTPFVTYGLIAANLLTWFGVQGFGSGPELVSSLCELGLIPAEVLGRAEPGLEVPLGPSAACVLEGRGSVWTLVSSMFLHGGWMHLIGNLWFLWIFGNNVEDSMGHVRFAIFYVLCGLAAGALQIGSDPSSVVPMVGASGAIGGVMGAYVILYPRVRVHLLLVLGFYVTTFPVPAAFMLGYWFLMQLLGGAAAAGQAGGGVAFWAHVGGFVAGVVLIFPFRDPRLVNRHPHHGWTRRRRT